MPAVFIDRQVQANGVSCPTHCWPALSPNFGALLGSPACERQEGADWLEVSRV